MGQLGHARNRVFADEVHKTHQDNVWISDAMTIARHSLAATFAIPPWRSGGVRFAELMEVQRQMAMLQLHRQVGIPVDAVFIVDHFSLRLMPQQEAPAEGTVHSYNVRAEGTGGRQFVQHLAFETSAGIVAEGKSHAKALPRALYDRLRGRPAAGVEPTSPQRSAGATAQGLRVDPEDPLVSDHESDHITALQIIVATEEAITSCTRHPLASMKLRFSRYAGLDPAPELVTEILPDGRFRGTVDQRGVPTTTFSGRTVEPLRQGGR